MARNPTEGFLYCFEPHYKSDIVWLKSVSKKDEILMLEKSCDDIFLLTKIERSYKKDFRNFYFLKENSIYKLDNITYGTFKLYFKEKKNEVI